MTSELQAPSEAPHPPEAKLSSKWAKAKTTTKRAEQATSNVFAMFDQFHIQEFKEAFNMIDQNWDLKGKLAWPGKNPKNEYLESIISKALRPINFTTFLTMFGEKLNGRDLQDVIQNSFACFN
ncbi:hypothetical protein P7K49_019267 [Saguinus oedipus]|uniref:Uncharacterized protein n=1 Tax=Saguinus oedipus TaxID=9490 RepID=A0ABQ9UXM0_SAGOE|nr:hypothetical protein P7K49_019267 [Saguinus oedipus]